MFLGNKCACHPEHYASLSVEQEIISKKLESRRAKDRARYANMTLEQRQAIRDRQNGRNATTDQIETRRARQRARYANMTSRSMQRETVNMHVESSDVILWVPNLVLWRTLCITHRIIPMIDTSNDSLIHQLESKSQSEPEQPSIARAVTARFVHEVKEKKNFDPI